MSGLLFQLVQSFRSYSVAFDITLNGCCLDGTNGQIRGATLETAAATMDRIWILGRNSGKILIDSIVQNPKLGYALSLDV